jgi:hypothetical protein
MAEPTCQAPLDVLKRSGLSDDKCAHLTKVSNTLRYFFHPVFLATNGSQVPNSLVDLLKGIHEDHWALVLDHIDHAVEPFRLQSQLASTSLGSLSSTPKYFPAPSNQSGSTNLPPQIDIPPSALKPPSAIRTPLPSQSRLIALSQNSENSAANYSIPQRTLNSTSTVHAPSVSHSRLIAPYPNSERFTASYSIPRSTLRLPSAIHPPPSSQSRLIAPSPNCEPSTTNHSTPAPSAPNMASHSPPQGLKRRLSFLGAEPSKKKAARGSGRLQDIGWALNDKITREDLQIRRDQFYKKLEAIEVERAKGNKKQAAASKKKILQTVIDVTNFFFDEVMGPDSFKRVASLIADYNARNYNQIGSNAVTRAVYLASINGIPTVVRSFYTSFANAERFNANSSNNYARLLKSIYDVELYKSFLSLHYSVEMRDPSLVQFLESKGLKTAIGRGYRSLVMKYLQRELGFDEERAELQNRFQAGQGLAQVVKHSSEGVLILLPPGTETRYARLHNSNMVNTKYLPG